MEDFESILPRIIKTELFSDFNIDDENDRRILKIVNDNTKQVKYKKGEVIIKEGERGDLFFILYSGDVNVFRNTPAGDKIALANLSSRMNIFFGETALVSNNVRSATVEAASDCTLISISGSVFNKLCEQEPVLGYRVFRHLALRMSQTISRTNNDKATLYEALFNEIEGDF